MKRFSNYFVGLILITIGTLWILNNLDLFDVDMRALLYGFAKLWPLVLVVIGVSVIVRSSKLTVIMVLIFLLATIFYGYSTVDKDNGDLINTVNEVYTEELSDGTKAGEVEFDLGGVEFEFSSDTSEFMTIKSNGILKYDSEVKDNTKKVYISNKDDFMDLDDNLKNRSVEIDINNSIPWKIDVDCGAVSGHLDFKEVDLKALDVDIGAGDMEIWLGDKAEETTVEIDSGASQITVFVPQDSGLKIELDGALNSSNLEELGLNKTGDDTYQSANYDKAVSRYNIDVDMGLGEFEVNYYK